MHHALFESPLGLCGIAWSDLGIVAVQLPDRTPDVTRAALRSRATSPGSTPSEEVALEETPGWVRAAAEAIAAQIAGSDRCEVLGALPLDQSRVPAFRRRVYAALRRVRPGQTTTYGELARAAGSPGAARAVGAAMAHNPFVIVVPCHRVLGAGGSVGGFSAPGGETTKRRLLEAEGAELPAEQLSL